MVLGEFDEMDAFFGVFVEQGGEDAAGGVAVLGVDVALLDVAGAFAAWDGRLIEGDVADEIEGVEILADLVLELVEQDALIEQFGDDGVFAVGGVPVLQEVVEGLVDGEDVFAADLFKGLGDEVAVGVDVLDVLGEDVGGLAVDVEFAALLVFLVVFDDADEGALPTAVGAAICAGVGVCGRYGWFGIGEIDFVVWSYFHDLDGFAVEGGITEEAGGVAEVHDGEVAFAEVFADAGAAADDLFELGHGVDVLIEHNQMAGLGIDAGAE